MKFSHREDEKKETGQYKTHEICNEGSFSLRLLLDHFMLKFGHSDSGKKDTDQYKTQKTCNKDD